MSWNWNPNPDHRIMSLSLIESYPVAMLVSRSWWACSCSTMHQQMTPWLWRICNQCPDKSESHQHAVVQGRPLPALYDRVSVESLHSDMVLQWRWTMKSSIQLVAIESNKVWRVHARRQQCPVWMVHCCKPFGWSGLYCIQTFSESYWNI